MRCVCLRPFTASISLFLSYKRHALLLPDAVRRSLSGRRGRSYSKAAVSFRTRITRCFRSDTSLMKSSPVLWWAWQSLVLHDPALSPGSHSACLKTQPAETTSTSVNTHLRTQHILTLQMSSHGAACLLSGPAVAWRLVLRQRSHSHFPDLATLSERMMAPCCLFSINYSSYLTVYIAD